MDKRSGLRQHYQSEEAQQAAEVQFEQRTEQLQNMEASFVGAITALIKFLGGHTSKTEVVNQLKSISTPDADKVVAAVSKLDADVLANKIELQPLIKELQGIKREMSLVPKTLPKMPEQKDSLKVTNLNEIKFDTTKLEKLIKDLKLDPKIEVKPADVNVEKPDLKPLQDIMMDMLKAVQKPKFPEIPKTDLTKVEEKLDESNKQLTESNKQLKKLVEKPTGGGGGGGNGTPYINGEGNAANVELEDDGSIPITDKASKPTAAYELVQYNDTDTSYEYYLYENASGTYYIKRSSLSTNLNEFKSNVTPTLGSGFLAWAQGLTSWTTYGGAF